jgi:hypothetical protein
MAANKKIAAMGHSYKCTRQYVCYAFAPDGALANAVAIICCASC